jgi:cystathionine gamma-synthase
LLPAAAWRGPTRPGVSGDHDGPRRPLSPETLAAQALGRVDPRTGALGPGIHPSTTFERDPDGGYSTGRGYIRPHNPTHDEPAQLLAALEGGSECLLFASGMAAATSVFQCLLPGDHVVVSRVMYWALRKWLIDFAMPWGLQVELVDAPDPAVVAAALRPGRTRLVWIETPANPTWAITDIAATAAIANEAGAMLVVDATVATPVLTRALEHGADLVVHSATKYLNGHSDVLAGALVCREQDAFWERVRAWHRDAGGVLGSFEAWLLQRGMRTLFVRVLRASASAQALAERLQAHPRVAEVLYPGLSSHPGHEVARRQMRGGFGGMLSIRVHGGRAAAMAVAAQVTVFKRATSLGGVESLIEHRASIEGPGSPVPDDLLRLSVGLEAVEDLAADLEQALARVGDTPAVPVAGPPPSRRT